MLHQDKENFLEIIKRTSAQTGFPLRLLEKDYYMTILLSKIGDLSDKLILKGGTCLNKIYYSYYRLSEDLDFSLKLSEDNTTRGMRRKEIKPVKESIQSFAKSFDMDIENPEEAGHNESTQYIYYFDYHSIILDRKESVKFEIGLRFNPVLPVEKRVVKHKFLHPFTGEPLFSAGNVTCLALKELVAEKLRAAATRVVIAARDFYDLGYLAGKGFDFKDKEFVKIFKLKLQQDGFPSELEKYRRNLGRADEEISDMKSRIEYELFSVLTIEEKESFNLHEVLNSFNKIMKDME